MELTEQNYNNLISSGVYNCNIKSITLAKYIAKEYCDFDEKEIDMMDIYWDAAFNRNWIYVDEDMIENTFGYSQNRASMSDFSKKLKAEFKENFDYKIIKINKKTSEKDKEFIKKFWTGKILPKNSHGGSNKNYHFITGETFKSMLASSPKGKVIRNYFIKIESLCKITNDALTWCITYIAKKQSEENERLLAESREIITKQDKLLLESKKTIEEKEEIIKSNTPTYSDQIVLNKVMLNRRLIKNKRLYRGSHKIESKNGISKFGSSKNSDIRARDHSTSLTEINKFIMEKIFETQPEMTTHTEHYAHAILEPFMVKTNPRKREHFLIHPKFLDKIVQKILEHQDELINECNKYIDLIEANDHDYKIVEELLNEFVIDDYVEELKDDNSDIDETSDSNEELDVESNNDSNSDSNNNLEDEKWDENEAVCKFMQWFKNNYKYIKNDKNIYIKLVDVFHKFTESKEYISASKDYKRNYYRKKHLQDIISNMSKYKDFKNLLFSEYISLCNDKDNGSYSNIIFYYKKI